MHSLLCSSIHSHFQKLCQMLNVMSLIVVGVAAFTQWDYKISELTTKMSTMCIDAFGNHTQAKDDYFDPYTNHHEDMKAEIHGRDAVTTTP